MLEEPVSAIMTVDDLVTVDVTHKVSRVRQLLDESGVHHLPVLDGRVLVGIISSTDLERLNLGNRYLDDATLDARLDESFTIEQVMVKAPLTLHPKDKLRRAAELFVGEVFNSLPIVDDEGELVGMLTSRDILRFFLARDKKNTRR